MMEALAYIWEVSEHLLEESRAELLLIVVLLRHTRRSKKQTVDRDECNRKSCTSVESHNRYSLLKCLIVSIGEVVMNRKPFLVSIIR
jgi:hypothetical protein